MNICFFQRENTPTAIFSAVSLMIITAKLVNLFSVIVASLGTCDLFTIKFIVALLQDMLSFHHWIGTELKKQLTHSLSVRDLK